jgi:AcrR family transcriptional regulator
MVTNRADDTDPMVEAALECFADRGVRQTSLTDVARRAGVSRATAYRAFAGKDDLVAAVARAEVERFTAQLAEAVDWNADIDEVIRRTVAFTLRYLEAHAVLQRVLREEPEQLAGVIVQRPGRVTLIELVRGGAERVLASHPGAGRLRATPAQVAEWGARVVFSLLLVPRTTLEGPDQIADLIAAGALGE